MSRGDFKAFCSRFLTMADFDDASIDTKCLLVIVLREALEGRVKDRHCRTLVGHGA